MTATNGKTGAELRFDLHAITARQMAALNRAIKANDIEAVAGFMTDLCVECPYGDPKDPETFLNLPYFGEFQTVIKALAEAGRDATKN